MADQGMMRQTLCILQERGRVRKKEGIITSNLEENRKLPLGKPK